MSPKAEATPSDPSLESRALLDDPQARSGLADWFLEEAGGSQYLEQTLSRILDIDSSLVPDVLKNGLDQDSNLLTLARARDERKQGLFASYVLSFALPDGETGLVEALPRPLPNAPKDSMAGIVVLCPALNLPDRAPALGLWEWDRTTGAFRSDPMHRILVRFSREEVPDKARAWMDLVHPQDRPAMDKAFGDFLRGRSEIFEMEHRLLADGGKVSWMLTRAVAERDPKNKATRVYGASLDVSPRMRKQRSLADQRTRSYALLDRLPAFVCLLSQNHEVRFANRMFLELFGEPGDLPCFRVLNDREEPCELCPAADVFETGSLIVWEWESPRGMTYQIYAYPFQETDGEPLALLMGMDVTQRKKVQDALRASEERYRSITDNLALGIMVLDKRMRVAAANPKIRKWFPFVDFDALPGLEEIFPLTEEQKRPVTFEDGSLYETLFEMLMREGKEQSKRSFRVTFCPIFTTSRRVESVIAMVDDVTEKLRVQARLQRARKLEALGTLAGGIAHEINQPLNALQLYVSGLEMLLEQEKDVSQETLLTRLSWIMKESGKIQDIITHMRALVQQDGATGVTACDMNAVVSQALTLVRAQLQSHNILLSLDLADDLPRVLANPVQLEQVVINLAINAMQAMDGMDSRTNPEKSLAISTAMREDKAILRIADNGPGITTHQERIFDPFFTTKDVGMGLGLSIVHTFVDSWGGDITARNNNPTGAVFTVGLLPAD